MFDQLHHVLLAELNAAGELVLVPRVRDGSPIRATGEPTPVLATRTLSELETLLRRRLKALPYRHNILGGIVTGPGLALDRPN
ncbi:hypothetical protein [Streptomyces avermitilis]|uniref:hypothetical protein n=1 Tax=Streptomyces avermitilis TaxID=33903 RepID=UPI0037F3EE5F